MEREGIPLIAPAEAASIGYSLSLMGLTLLNVAMKAMSSALSSMARGAHPPTGARLPFEDLYRTVGFEDHYQWESRFAAGQATEGTNEDLKRRKLGN